MTIRPVDVQPVGRPQLDCQRPDARVRWNPISGVDCAQVCALAGERRRAGAGATASGATVPRATGSETASNRD